jgi:hypothetical protein
MHIPLNQCENVPFYTFVRGNFANRKINCKQGGANSLFSFLQVMLLQ